ncbi:MAG TPA: hypothetical protein VMB85_22640 [Bryobacteraceae bacterium]|nr:hypothetical protein [Bryobacteraceae bacterium]
MKTILTLALLSVALQAQSVTIVNSGSTNTAGFQIVVQESGEAEYRTHPRPIAIRRGEAPKKIQKTIPKSLVDRLYADVEAAQPLDSLPARHCVKSASFGTRTYIDAGGQESPDLSCGDGGNAKLRALIRDSSQIVEIFRPH